MSEKAALEDCGRASNDCGSSSLCPFKAGAQPPALAYSVYKIYPLCAPPQNQAKPEQCKFT
jgi:hypothetical protein